MKRNLYTLLVFISVSFFPNLLAAQTGPGGVGNSATNRIWMDASTLAFANGASVTSWPDKSGNGWTGLSSTTSSRPIYRTNQLNGFPSVDFDGVNDNCRIANVTGINGQPITWFVVGNFNVINRSQAMVHFSYSGSGFNRNLRYTLYYSNNNKIFSSNLNNLHAGPVANHSLTTSTQILSALGTNNTMTSFTNGSQTGSFTTTFLSPINNNLFFTLGMRSYLNDYNLDGNVAEAIVFNYTLTSVERILVENYLSSKYAVAMTANDRYAMEGSGHFHTVTGIGMESGNSVTSAEGRSLVTISAPSALANGDYLLWGSNNASLTVNSTDVPTQFANFGGTRLNRTWRVDETGDVGTYTVAIDMTTMPALGPSTADYVLMIDDDGNFSNGGTTYQYSGYSFAANTATWTGVDIPDGSYFTVAYVPAIFSITTGPWSDPNTWNCTCVPSDVDDVFISAGDLVSVDGFSEAFNLTVVPTGSIDFGGLNPLVVYGDLDIQGTLDGTNGRLTFAGSSGQNLSATSTVILQEMEVNNSSGVTIQSGDYMILSSGTYFPTEGDLDVSGANSFIFDSDASGSARIDQFSPSSSISGPVTFRRFIPAGTGGYRDLASPLSGGSTVSAFDDDMFISGQTSQGFADGCASSQSGCFYSFKFFVGNTYTNITNAGTNIPNATRGAHAWVSDSYPNGLNNPVIIDLTGSVNGFGDIVATATGTNTFTLIGNPYISQIDFDELDRTDIGDFYYVWDVNINNFNWYQMGNGASPLTNVIASGQGFVVMPETNFGTVTFDQTDKTTESASFIRSQQPLADYFRVKLKDPNTNYSCDVTINVNENASNGYDRFDLPTPYGEDEKAIYLSAQADDKIVRCFGMNSKEEIVSIPLITKIPSIGTYSFTTQNLEIFNQYKCVVLEDLETGSKYNLRDLAEIRFVFNETGESTRFMLHLSNDICHGIVAGISLNDSESIVEMTQFDNNVKVEMNFTDEENVTISVFNILGQPVLSENHSHVTNKSVNLTLPSHLSNGVYLVVVETVKKKYTRKFNF